MEAHNIGSNKPSVKVHHNPGGQSNFSLYWNQPDKVNPKLHPANIMKYHNESHFSLGKEAQNQEEEEERKRLEEEARKKEEEEKKREQLNSKLPSYDPKNGTKTNVFFGNEPTDYRKKDEVFTSVKVKAPPGGRSNIQFG